MCEAMEKVLKEREKRNCQSIARDMLIDGILSMEKIAKYSRLPFSEVERIAKELPQ